MASEFPQSFKDPAYASLDAQTEKKLGLPVGLLASVRTNGERTNHSQSNDLNTFGVYQFIPATRKAILDKYGIDVTLNPQNASEGAGLLLKEGLERNKGDASQAVGEYIGGTDRGNWGKTTNAYVNRVMVGQQAQKTDALDNGFAKFMAANPAVPAGRGATAAPAAPAAPAEKKADTLTDGFGSWLRAQESKPASIPGSEEYDARATPAPATVGEQLVGAGETALNVGTGMTGGAVGALGGTAKGLYDTFANPTPGMTGLQQMSKGAEEGAAALTYQPRTEAGQSQAASAGNFLANTVPLMGMAPQMAAAGRVAEVAKPTLQAIPAVARNTVASAAENVAAGARVATERVGQMAGRESATPTPGTMAGVGSAGTDLATQRQTTAQNLPVPINLTEGQKSRQFEQLRFEGETAKDPRLGQPLRERAAEQNAALPRNFDALIDQTGAQAPTGIETGRVVSEALTKDAARSKNEYRVKYREAEKAGELADPVATDAIAKAINDSASAESTAPVIGAAKKELQRLGGATVDENGNLVGGSLTLGDMEQLRKFVNKTTGIDPTNQKFAIDLKTAIDGATEGLGGQSYKDARKARQRHAQLYEDNAVVADLLASRRGTSDRKVALENVFNRTILNGSREDLSMLRRTLQVSKSEEGQQAWKELQGATLRHIMDESTKGVGTDIHGNPIVSAAKMNSTVRALETGGKLDFVLGKQGAQTVRDINDIAKVIYTQPPGAVNTSNTASVLLAALAEAGVGGSLTGLPVPVLTGMKVLSGHVKDRRIQKRVDEALGNAMRKERARPRPIQMKKTIH